MTLQQFRSKYQELLLRKSVLRKENLKQTAKLAEAVEEHRLLLRTCELAKLVLQGSLNSKQSIEGLLSQGLTEIFGVECTFVLEEVLENGIPKGFKPVLKEGDGEFDDPDSSVGNGAKAIMSICLKIAEILAIPGTPRLLVMDEPLAPLSTNYQERFEDFMKTVCEATGIQVIMITHQPFPFGKIVEVTKKSGCSVVTEKVKIDG